MLKNIFVNQYLGLCNGQFAADYLTYGKIINQPIYLRFMSIIRLIIQCPEIENPDKT
jgi:hypothetical protein